jgi:hypothetical protein
MSIIVKRAGKPAGSKQKVLLENSVRLAANFPLVLVVSLENLNWCPAAVRLSPFPKTIRIPATGNPDLTSVTRPDITDSAYAGQGEAVSFAPQRVSSEQPDANVAMVMRRRNLSLEKYFILPFLREH